MCKGIDMEFIRKAKESDLARIVYLLTDDSLGKTREGSLDSYTEVFNELILSEYFDVFVMELNGKLIGCYQIMYLPHLSFAGTKRAQVESVRIESSERGQGFGGKLIKHAIETARNSKCGILQLTSNKERVEANKFYKDLGLEATHDGYKMYFEN
jgi:ribosomal protein S18 acetylase RimI-like enzyme